MEVQKEGVGLREKRWDRGSRERRWGVCSVRENENHRRVWESESENKSELEKIIPVVDFLQANDVPTTLIGDKLDINSDQSEGRAGSE